MNPQITRTIGTRSHFALVNIVSGWLARMALITLFALPCVATAQSSSLEAASIDISDAKIVQLLPGFKNEYLKVNGTRLHFVIGGSGAPLVLLPGWPETWWEFHKMMPTLAKHYRVIVVDLRGMGGSDRPASGYDKKNMAKDIYELVQQLGYQQIFIAGHDIGSQVAYSFAANYPQATRKVALLDVAPPDKSLMNWPILPVVGTFGEKIDPNHAFPWWFAFHQVKGLPEKLLAGRINLEMDWIFKYLAVDELAISVQDRSIYVAAYNSAEAIRAGDAWYQAFPQDIVDTESYKNLDMPVLAMGGPGYEWLKFVLARKAPGAEVVQIENSGHFIPEEQPDVASRWLMKFFQ
jgi:pimeloyl-ACP methyl ester carboxylesterase